MRIIAIILLMLLQGLPLLASRLDRINGGALTSGDLKYLNSKEELTAAWEGESNSELIGERVLDDLLKRKSDVMKLNAMCSPQSIEKLASLRKLAADIISSASDSCSTTSEINTAKTLLGDIATVSFTGLSDREAELVKIAERMEIAEDLFALSGLNPSNIPKPELAVTVPAIHFTVSQVVKLKNIKNKTFEREITPLIITCRSLFFDTEFADLYKLFLYVRDNSGNGTWRILTYNCFTSPLKYTQYNSTRYIFLKTAAATSTTISIHSGASS